jgi:hypothetical protein
MSHYKPAIKKFILNENQTIVGYWIPKENKLTHTHHYKLPYNAWPMLEQERLLSTCTSTIVLLLLSAKRKMKFPSNEKSE